MSFTRSSVGVRAMSLIELLCVMAIITLLAALLLPALGQGQARARRMQCINHLHEVGVGFASFANDHNGQFPMAVPASAGSSQELAQGGYRLQGDFYFSFRYFQAASNELVTPRLLVCPADTRLPATSFSTLSNANLSYFIGVNAEVVRSSSILAGDRNLTNDYSAPGSLVRLGHNHPLRWTEELHRFKGNLLFSDGHVEQKNSPALVATGDQEPAIADLALPTLRQPGAVALASGGGLSPWAPSPPAALAVPVSVSRAPTTNAKVLVGAYSVTRPGRSAAPNRASAAPADGAPEKAPSPPRVEKQPTNAVPATNPANPPPEDIVFSRFGLWLAAEMSGAVEQGLWGFYPLLLLLATAILVLRKVARGRKKRAAETPHRFP